MAKQRTTTSDWLRLAVLVVSLISTAATVSWYVAGLLHQQSSALERIERQTKGRWTASDMKLWTTQLEAENVPIMLVVPDPWDVVNHRDDNGR